MLTTANNFWNCQKLVGIITKSTFTSLVQVNLDDGTVSYLNNTCLDISTISIKENKVLVARDSKTLYVIEKSGEKKVNSTMRFKTFYYWSQNKLVYIETDDDKKQFFYLCLKSGVYQLQQCKCNDPKQCIEQPNPSQVNSTTAQNSINQSQPVQTQNSGTLSAINKPDGSLLDSASPSKIGSVITPSISLPSLEISLPSQNPLVSQSMIPSISLLSSAIPSVASLSSLGFSSVPQLPILQTSSVPPLPTLASPSGPPPKLSTPSVPPPPASIKVPLSKLKDPLYITGFERILWDTETNFPAIYVEYNRPMTNDEYIYARDRIEVESLQALTFTKVPIISSDLISKIKIQITFDQAMSFADVDVRATNQTQNMSIHRNFHFEPLFNPSKSASETELKLVKKIQEAQQSFNGDLINSLGYVGFLSLLLNSPQEIVQLQFLNYTVPMNVYQFESLICLWVLDNDVPQWEVFPQITDASIYKNDITEDIKDEGFILERYSRIMFVNNFLYNVQIHIILVVAGIILTCLVSLFKKRRVDNKILKYVQTFDMQPMDLQTDEQKPIQIQLTQAKTYLQSKLEKENILPQWGKFIVLQCFLEGKLCIFINSAILSLYQPNFSTTFSIICFTIMLVFLSAYTFYMIYMIAVLQKEFIQRDKLYKISLLLKSNNNVRQLLWQHDSYLRHEYKYFLENRRMNDQGQFYSVYLFLIKKWLYAVILVCLYDRVVVQLFLLIIIHSFATLFKLTCVPHRYLIESIIAGVGDVTFVIVLGLKFHNFNDLQKLESDNESARQWITNGWVTICFEMIFILIYMIQFFVSIVIKFRKKKEMEMNNQEVYDRLEHPKPTGQNELGQPNKKQADYEALNDGPNDNYEYNFEPFQPFQQQIPDDLLQQQTYVNELNNNEPFSYDSEPYYVNYPEIYDSYQSPENFTQNNIHGVYMHQSSISKQGTIPLMGNIQLNYEFKRCNNVQPGEPVKSNSDFLKGIYQLTLLHNEKVEIKEVFVGLAQPFDKDLKFVELNLQKDSLNTYSYALKFNSLLEELTSRQFQVKIVTFNLIEQRTEQIIILLSGNELLLFESNDNQEKDVRNFTCMQSVTAILNENRLGKYLQENYAKHINSHRRVHRIRMNYPIINAVTACYKEILLQFTHIGQNGKYQIELFTIQEEKIIFDRESDILTHFLESLMLHLKA